MPTLASILDTVRAGLPARRAERAALERVSTDLGRPPDLVAALRHSAVALIAEIKRRSPSAGAINERLEPVALAEAYTAGGAAAISVLTNQEYFGGSLDDLRAVATATTIPVLRKDFIVDEIQLLEARAAGASAALLIVRALDPATLTRLVRCAVELEMTPLVEAHDQGEIERAVDAGAVVIGVNARDLDSMTIDVAAAWAQLRHVPRQCIAVAESGMATVADVNAAADAGADAVLVGSALAASVDPAAHARALSEALRRAG